MKILLLCSFKAKLYTVAINILLLCSSFKSGSPPAKVDSEQAKLTEYLISCAKSSYIMKIDLRNLR